MKRYILAIACLILALASAEARPKDDMVTVKPSVRGAKSTFAIFTDSLTYAKCAPALNAYRDVLQQEGLGTFIYAANWDSPETVKSLIKNAYKRDKLEGVVFVGDVPMVRVSGAQHMTTAFKMDQERFPREESWVTTDRFYDDFDLDWRYCDKDTTGKNVYYYQLTERGAQHLASDIYTARMIVPDILPGDKYQILSDYLAEVVRAHKEDNPLDNVIYYGGSGYNGDCLTLWRQKPIVWREYFPLAFDSADNNKFYNFRYSPTVKYQLFNELQRPGTDLFQFSEHGDANVQYISSDLGPMNLEENLYAMRSTLRYYYKRAQKRGEGEEFLAEVYKDYYTGADQFTPDKYEIDAARDSADQADTNMYSSDIVKLHSQPRVLIFNACYNGSFYQGEDYIAGCHIFNGGRSIVAQGNTVNALQDKYEDELMGMLHLGYRVGQWQQKLPYLESHLIGDPTYRFQHIETPSDANSRKALEVRQMADKALGQGRNCSAQLLDIYRKSSSWEVRLEALHCLSFFPDENFVQGLIDAFDDPYEHIQRMACIYAGDNGDPRLEEGLRRVIATQDQSVRVKYVAEGALTCFESSRAKNDEYVAGIFDASASLKERVSAIRFLRNNPLHYDVDRYVAFVLDDSQPERLRVVMAEALGWFDRSWQRKKIEDGLKIALSRKYKCPPEVREEMIKTLRRLY